MRFTLTLAATGFRLARLTIRGFRQKWEEMTGDQSEHLEDAPGRDVGPRIVKVDRKRDAHLSGSRDEGGSHALAQGAESLPHYVEVHRPLGNRTRRRGHPVLRVARRLSRQEMVEGSGRGVAPTECFAEFPSL